ncbi:MAG: apolipoprotein N-acyltransferase [Bacteroidales bacterium]|nr:apolipoprotein N-acyltransferase [Bacteroidales bacterium]
MKKRIWLLLFQFVLMASVPFLVPHTGWVSLFAFVPLFALADICDNPNSGIRHPNWIIYTAFLLFNVATTFWIWWVSPVGSIAAFTLNALQMFVIFLLFRKSKKVFSGTLPYLFFICMWIAWERVYQNIELSWPWLVLGNSLATSPILAQWYESTGALGGTLWILLSNSLIYACLRSLAYGEFAGRKRIALFSFTGLLLAVPMILSVILYNGYKETDDPVEVVALQPNIDSYTEKHGGLSQQVQDMTMLSLAENAVTENTKYVITPETFSYNFQLDNPEGNNTYLNVMKFLDKHPQVSFILGTLSYQIYYGASKPTYTSNKLGENVWYDMYNTAIMIDTAGMRNYYHKSKLVAGVEIIPYQRYLPFLGNFISKFGGSASSYARSHEVENLESSDGQQVGVMICYESVYPDYYRQTALKGAGFNAIITNDGWWGDTPGYRQHFRYASLRCIENRRDVVHVANTGITGFINQRGDVLQRTSWWEPVSINGTVNLNYKQTYFTRNGDLVGRVSTFLFCLLLLALISKAIILKKKS